MKGFLRYFRIIVFIAVIVFSLSTCKKDLLDGTSWMANFQDVKIILRYNSPNFTISTGGHMLIEGTYSISDNKISMSEVVLSEDIDNAVILTGTLSGNILSIIMGYETIAFSKRHSIFN